MQKRFILPALLTTLLLPSLLFAVEPAARITDREIVERLTRLEEGLKGVEQSLRAEIRANAEAINQLRADMNVQFDRMEAQFGRVVNLMLGIVGAFTALVATTIGFAIWDRRTMIRPFESKARDLEEQLSQNRQRLHALLEALRALGQSDDKVAEVLRRFNLL